MEKFNTLIIGASTNPERESFHVVKLFIKKQFPILAIGQKEGMIDSVSIQKGLPPFQDIHTITLYVGAKNQAAFYDYILQIKSKRLIFNPGAENLELFNLAVNNGIDAVNACTRTMLTVGNYDSF